MDNREANYNSHPPMCTCKACEARRLDRLDTTYTKVPYGGGGKSGFRGINTSDAEKKGLLVWDYKTGNYVLPKPKVSKVSNDVTATKSVRSKNMHITHKILAGIAIIFAILTGISLTAWLFPGAFDDLAIFLIAKTQNNDIMLNVQRLREDPITFSIIFSILALFSRWMSSKF